MGESDYNYAVESIRELEKIVSFNTLKDGFKLLTLQQFEIYYMIQSTKFSLTQQLFIPKILMV